MAAASIKKKTTNDLAEKIYDKRVLNKFTTILSTKYKIFAFRQEEAIGELIIFYISDKIIDVETEGSDSSIAFISCFIHYSDNELTIKFVKTNPSFSGNGLGIFLMILAGCYANSLKNKTITKVTLDDCSDNAWNMENNLYIKLGLSYVNEEPEPEMEGEISVLISKWNEFKIKYQDRIKNL